MQRQRPRGTTSRDTIVAAALAVVDRDGVDALTIRAVAKLAGAPPMSLTRTSQQNELLDMMYTEVSRAVRRRGATTWQAELRHVSAGARGPEGASQVGPLPRAGASSGAQKRERLLRMMTDTGNGTGGAGRALPRLTLDRPCPRRYRMHEGGQPNPTARFERLKDWITSAATEEESVTRVGFSRLPSLEPIDTFEFALRMLIAGIEAERWGQPASTSFAQPTVESLRRA